MQFKQINSLWTVWEGATSVTSKENSKEEHRWVHFCIKKTNNSHNKRPDNNKSTEQQGDIIKFSILFDFL